ncbi:MAG: hypothetical protein PUD72_06220 [Oscillospiraceae bacterium]|nr:hypothetical protein [Oscillospiraceae bacterium]
MDKNNIREYELGLDLVTIFVGPLKKWKKIIVSGLVFAVLLSGFSFANLSGIVGRETKEEKIENYKTDVAQLEKEINMLEREYDSNKNYMDKSILMSMNNDNAYTGYAKFNISVTAEEEIEQKQLINKFRSVYEHILDDEETLDFIRKEIPNVDDVYLSELIKCSTSGSDGLITVTFSYTDKEVVQNVINHISTSFETYYEKDSNSNEYSLDSLGINVRKGLSSSFDRTYSSSVIKQLADLDKQIEEKKDELSSVDSPYFTFKSFIKYVLVGFVGGAIVAYGVLLLMIVLLGRIESINQVKITFGTNSVLSTFAIGGEPSKIMKKLLYKGLNISKDDFIKTFKNNFSVITNGENKRTLIIGERDLALDGYIMSLGGESSENLEKLADSDSVIIEIEIGKTKINDIIEEIQRIEFYGKDFLGFIVLV